MAGTFQQFSLGGISAWQLDAWKERGIKHGFLGVDIDLKQPFENVQQKLRHKVGDKDLCLHLLKQVHGVEIVEVLSRQIPEGEIRADGWLFDSSIGLDTVQWFGIKTADCFPVLLISKNFNLGSALHCGWRGAIGGLLVKALERFVALGVKPEEIEIAIGPGAQACCYQIGSELVPRFEAAVPKNLEILPIVAVRRSQGKLFGNIPEILFSQACHFGLAASSIFVSRHCTICGPGFYSYRRDGENAGRQLSFLALKC